MSFLDKLGASIPLIGGYLDNSGDQAMSEVQKNQALYGGINTPTFNKYIPQQYQVAGELDPKMAEATQISEDPSLRGKEMDSLNRLAGLSQTGLSDVDNQGYERARELGDQQSSSGISAALQNAQSRGIGGSGLEFAMREQAGQAGAGRAMDAGLQQAGDSAKQRALYAQAFGSMAGSMRGQDFTANSANSNILNRFNELNTGAANQAQQYNLGNQQNTMNMNTQGANNAQMVNNNQAQQTYLDQMQKAGAQAGANTAMAGAYGAQEAANTGNRNSNTALVAQAVSGGAGGGASGGGGGSQATNNFMNTSSNTDSNFKMPQWSNYSG